MAINFGKLLGGLGKTALGAVGGVAGDYVAGQLFGKKNKPSSMVKGALTPAANPYAGQVAGNLQSQSNMGADFLQRYNPMLTGAVQKRADSINAGYGQDEMGRIALGNAQTGADAAYGRGRANLSLNLARRGLGGGVLAGGLSNLEGQRAGVMTQANNQVAQNRIQGDIAGQRELLAMYQNLMNQGQNYQQGANQGLLGVGNMEVQRQAQGQQNIGDLAGLLAMLYGQGQGTKKPAKSWASESDLYGAFGGMLK